MLPREPRGGAEAREVGAGAPLGAVERGGGDLALVLQPGRRPLAERGLGEGERPGRHNRAEMRGVGAEQRVADQIQVADGVENLVADEFVVVAQAVVVQNPELVDRRERLLEITQAEAFAPIYVRLAYQPT